ncbi:MAG: hypothetical protein Q9193_000946, partial [Seirophora villosa]
MSSAQPRAAPHDVSQVCQHQELLVTPSPHATEVGYFPPVHKAATSKRKRDENVGAVTEELYPAPLVLPGDELALDPKHPPQSVQSWRKDKDRNPVTRGRNVIYVAAPPEVGPDVDFVASWVRPKPPRQVWQKASDRPMDSSPVLPDIKDIITYLSAFYHPLSVKNFPSPLVFASWEDSTTPDVGKPSSSHNLAQNREPARSFVALRTSTELIRIRTRPSPDSLFPSQLNLDDLLDVAISILPSDAYCLLLLVSHDLYEDDDDAFVCGRAYGGSRVAVVSSARYNPALDDIHGVDRLHAWPASHCREYVETCCSAAPSSLSQQKTKSKPSVRGTTSSTPITLPRSLTSAPTRPSPLHRALGNHLRDPPSAPLLYLIRLALTSAHELGHCFGLEHCVYYACCMQGSASLVEDARQPPYLCPVCEEKVSLATGADRRERLRRIRE